MDILSVFGIRGRSKEVHHLNDALRDVGLHSARVPDSVKLAAVKLLKEAEGENSRPREELRRGRPASRILHARD